MVRPLFGVWRLPYAHGMTLPFSEARALADDARGRALELGKALSWVSPRSVDTSP